MDIMNCVGYDGMHVVRLLIVLYYVLSLANLSPTTDASIMNFD